MGTHSSSNGPALFDSFLRDRAISMREAAAALGVTHVTIIEWRRGTTRPRHALRRLIAKWTSGVVPADSWAVPGERPPPKPSVRPWRPAAA